MKRSSEQSGVWECLPMTLFTQSNSSVQRDSRGTSILLQNSFLREEGDLIVIHTSSSTLHSQRYFMLGRKETQPSIPIVLTIQGLTIQCDGSQGGQVWSSQPQTAIHSQTRRLLRSGSSSLQWKCTPTNEDLGVMRDRGKPLLKRSSSTSRNAPMSFELIVKDFRASQATTHKAARIAPEISNCVYSQNESPIVTEVKEGQSRIEKEPPDTYKFS